MKILSTIVGLVLSLWFWGGAPALATSIYDIPDLTEDTRIIDQAGVLSLSNEGAITSTLKKLAEATSNQVHLVTIHRFDYGETAETFVEQLFQKWFPTAEQQSKQVLVLLDNVTNTAAIKVGPEIDLPEAIATSIIQETLIPLIQDDNKYNQAFAAVSDRLAAVLSGQPDPGAVKLKDDVKVASTFKSSEETDKKNSTIWVIVLLSVATIVPMVTYFVYQGFSNQ